MPTLVDTLEWRVGSSMDRSQLDFYWREAAWPSCACMEPEPTCACAGLTFAGGCAAVAVRPARLPCT